MWKVWGFDTCEEEPYMFVDHPEEGFEDEDEMLQYARRKFSEIQKDQPPEENGHNWEQGSQQDKVIIMRPDHSRYVFEP